MRSNASVGAAARGAVEARDRKGWETMTIGATFLQHAANRFRGQKRLAERAVRQLDDAALRRALHPETNSIAVIMKHMAGNMLSRWTDFLTSDGEKAWRERDREFIDDAPSREAIFDHWEKGWARLFSTLESLTVRDLEKTITIRGEEHTVVEAILRQLDHYGYHVGQIVLLARLHVGDGPWETLSIPRGGSEAFNRQKREERKPG